MIRHHIPPTVARTLVRSAAVLTIAFAGASCSSTSGTTATATATDPPGTVAPTSTSAPTSTPTTAVTAPAPTTTAGPTTTTTMPGQAVVFAMSDGELAFTLSTDEIGGTARFTLEPVDGATPRWQTVVPWVDEANASGHRPFDGLPAEPVSGGDAADANLALVQDYVRTALVEGRWEDVDRFFADGRYVLHGPLFADGLESVRSFFIGLRDAGVPFLITATSVWLAAGDFVLAINRHDADGVSTAYWDLWRVENGTIAEHWDAISTIDAGIADAWFAGSGPTA